MLGSTQPEKECRGIVLKIHNDQLVRRVFGTVTAFGFYAFGLYALLGSNTLNDPLTQDRAFWFGVTLIIGGSLALLMSWLVKEVDGVWCGSPKRWKNRR